MKVEHIRFYKTSGEEEGRGALKANAIKREKRRRESLWKIADVESGRA